MVKYENGKYSVVEGTSVYDLYPNIIENYCENEGVYITKTGKYETSDELYKSVNMSHKNKIIKKNYWCNWGNNEVRSKKISRISKKQIIN